MTTHFMQNGSMIRFADGADVKVFPELPAGTYSVGCDPFGNFYLQIIKDMKIEGKMYGNIHDRTDRIINTFSSRPRNTGVILHGTKGSGKTMLTKLLSVKLREQNIPTILVNGEYSGEGFNQFLQKIAQPCYVLFDEFEKLYSAQAQSQLLTLFDGVHSSKKLFVITTNESYRINDYMRNRPGRFFYSFRYGGLDQEFIREYCEDNLTDKTRTNSVLAISSTFHEFSFDVLQAIVEEMNRYGETPQQTLEFLNAFPDAMERVYNVVDFVPSKEYSEFLYFSHSVGNGASINIFDGDVISIDIFKMHPVEYAQLLDEEDEDIDRDDSDDRPPMKLPQPGTLANLLTPKRPAKKAPAEEMFHDSDNMYRINTNLLSVDARRAIRHDTAKENRMSIEYEALDIRKVEANGTIVLENKYGILRIMPRRERSFSYHTLVF